MALSKQKGNMYPWVTHMHTHIAGRCLHECEYCYVQRGAGRLSGKYSGPIRLIEKELEVDYGSDKVIFIEHMTDMFAYGVPRDFCRQILSHCYRYPQNTYVFQTKNPEEYSNYLIELPPYFLCGVTIETNRSTRTYSNAPSPMERAGSMEIFKIQYKDLYGEYPKTFLTIEPIMDFDLVPLMAMIEMIKPDFVNIGADSKNSKLPEPSADKIEALIKEIQSSGYELREKHNLSRLLDFDDETDTRKKE